MRVCCLLSAFVLLTALDARGDDKDERDKLQGTWKVMSMINEGKISAADKIKGARLTIEGDRFTLKGADENFRGTFKIDSSKKPRHIDTTFVGEDNKEAGRAQGIYELDGKKLRICWTQAKDTRPSEFSDKGAKEVRVMTLERE